MGKINKEIALEIIQSGYLRMAKKFHPDVGGTHDQMLELIATKEHLEQFITGRTGAFEFTRAREEPRRPYRNTRYWSHAPKDEYTGNVPLEPYPDDADYVQLVDVTIMSVTEKAIRIKIPGVKQGQWLPKSQILDIDGDPFKFIDGEVITVVFTKWIAKQKGWMK